MILPFPTRIPVLRALIFTSVLVIAQLVEKTDPVYSFLTFCFFMLSVFAFNVAGGFSRPSGAYIFFYSVLVVVVGTVSKVLFGEPAQTHLQSPLLLMLAYVASIAGLLLAAYLTRKIATTTEGIAGILHVPSINYHDAALGSFILYLILIFGGSLLPGSGGAILHSLEVINPFLLLSLLLSTVAAVRDSRGWRSTSTLSLIIMGFSLLMGTLNFTKQGMFTPITCWLIGIGWARFRLRFVHFVAVFAFAVFGGMVLAPISQVGRNEATDGSISGRLALIEYYLTHISEVRAKADVGTISDQDRRMFYYDNPHGLLDRLSMIPNDSVLIDFTNSGHYFGYLPVYYYFENWVPHLIAPHKLEGIMVGGNTYMHEMGGLAEEDTTTGISFSPTAEAFHMDGWTSLLLVAPPIWLLLFVTADASCGDLRRQPLGLLYLIIFAHTAPEGGIGAPIDMVRLVNAGFIVALVFCGYVAPVIGMLLRGHIPAEPRLRTPANGARLPDAFEVS